MYVHMYIVSIVNTYTHTILLFVYIYFEFCQHKCIILLFINIHIKILHFVDINIYIFPLYQHTCAHPQRIHYTNLNPHHNSVFPSIIALQLSHLSKGAPYLSLPRGLCQEGRPSTSLFNVKQDVWPDRIPASFLGGFVG